MHQTTRFRARMYLLGVKKFEININTKESASEGDKYQFGFKAGHSTSMCTGAVSYTHLTLPTKRIV